MLRREGCIIIFGNKIYANEARQSVRKAQKHALRAVAWAVISAQEYGWLFLSRRPRRSASKGQVLGCGRYEWYTSGAGEVQMQEAVERTVQINRASCAREGERTDPCEPEGHDFLEQIFGRGQKKVRRSRVNVHGRKVFFQCCSVAGIWDLKLGRLALKLRLVPRLSFCASTSRCLTPKTQFGEIAKCNRKTVTYTR